MPTDIIVSPETPDETTVIGIKSIIITDAQFKALPTTPIAIIPAPGVGKANVIISAGIYRFNITDVYTNVNAGALIGITYNPTNSYATLTVNVPDWLNFAGDTFMLDPIRAFSDLSEYVSGQVSDFENIGMAIIAENPTAGNFTGGNAANTLKVTVYYVVVDV